MIYTKLQEAVGAMLEPLHEAEGEAIAGGGPAWWKAELASIRSSIEEAGTEIDARQLDSGAAFKMWRNSTDPSDSRPVVTVNDVKLRHLSHHSPDGFEWGYAGSGPADLARSIVGHILNDDDPHPKLYQPVKDQLLAGMPEEGGEIHEHEVRAILAGLDT